MRIAVFDSRASAPAAGQDWFAGHEALVSQLAARLGPADLDVDLTLVDDATMTDLNRRWRQKAGPTDVLSFSDLVVGAEPCLIPAGSDFAACDLGLEGPGERDEPGRLLVGEIIIAPAFVEERCLENGWSVAAEYPLLVVHGLLHVLGWEHDTETRRQAMQDVEEEILGQAGLTHPLRQRS